MSKSFIGLRSLLVLIPLGLFGPAAAAQSMGDGLHLELPTLANPLSPSLQTDDEQDDGEASSRRSKRRRSHQGSFAPEGRTFGIGLQVGSPTGLTLKYMLTPDQALQGGIGAAFVSGLGRGQSLDFHVDYVYHPQILLNADAANLSWYVGGGAFVAVVDPGDYPYFPGPIWYPRSTPFWLGARIPIGLDLAFNRLPIELFLEGVPMVLLFPRLAFGMGAALGLRFYF